MSDPQDDGQSFEGVEVESEGALAQINKLISAAMDDAELCDILVDRGYLQTVKDDKGNVNGVSWVGFGPDLTPPNEPQSDPDAEQQTDPDAPESPLDDAAPKSDEDAAYKDEAQSEVVETVKTKANGR